jgi:flagellar biosynthesis protein FliR
MTPAFLKFFGDRRLSSRLRIVLANLLATAFIVTFSLSDHTQPRSPFAAYVIAVAQFVAVAAVVGITKQVSFV